MRYQLNIYGIDDEIVKTYSTNIVPWGVFIKAAALQETMSDKNAIEQINAISQILQVVFVGLTDEELAHADATDIMSVFSQITNNGTKIGGKSKNA